MTICRSCGQSFGDYKELAVHIASSKKGHRKGKLWAAKYLTRVNSLDRKKLAEHKPLTEADKENKQSTIRELSGEVENVLAVCPHCHKGHREVLPVEFTQNLEAWREKNCVVVLCQSCAH